MSLVYLHIIRLSFHPVFMYRALQQSHSTLGSVSQNLISRLSVNLMYYRTGAMTRWACQAAVLPQQYLGATLKLVLLKTRMNGRGTIESMTFPACICTTAAGAGPHRCYLMSRKPMLDYQMGSSLILYSTCLSTQLKLTSTWRPNTTRKLLRIRKSRSKESPPEDRSITQRSRRRTPPSLLISLVSTG